jgi:hypothetical protein
MPFLVTRRSRVAVFLVLDVIAVGAGMGVPIFAIFLGFPVGWFLAGEVGLRRAYTGDDLKSLLRSAALTSAVTFALMAVIWLHLLRMLSGPRAAIASFGLPLLLYDPVASLVGWVVLMVIVSPVLQVLTTVFGWIVRLALRPVR